MISSSKITEIFCSIDDFCLEFVPLWQKSLLDNGKKRIRISKMSLSEVITIQVLFHFSGYKTFKEFYLGYVCKHLTDYFPNRVSYNRMVELKNICQVEHSRHRSVANYFNNIFAALIAYNFKDRKPSLKKNFVDTKQLYLNI